MGVPSVRQVWRLALPAATKLLNTNGDLTRAVLWARRMAAHTPAFAALEEGEVVLLSVEALRLLDERLTLAQVVASLAKRNVSALAVVGPVSEEAVAAADDVGLCLLALPADADLRDIEKDTIRLIVEREAQLDRRGRQVYRQLAQCSIENHGLGAIAEALWQIVGKPVMIQDEGMAIQALASGDDSPFSPQDLQAIRADKAPLHRWLMNQSLDGRAPPCTTFGLNGDGARYVAAIVIEGKLRGYLSILGTTDTLDDLDRLAAERGSLVCAVELAKQRAVEAAEQRLQGDFVDLLLIAGAVEEPALSRRAAEMGYDLERTHVVVLLSASENVCSARLDSEFRAALANDGAEVLLCPYGDDLAALCSSETSPSLDALEESTRIARGRIADRFPGVRIAAGIGRPGAGLAGLRRSFAQAQESLDLVQGLLGGDKVLSFGDLGLYHLLRRLQNCEELADFYSGTLAPLVAYDTRHDTELVNTLAAFFAHCGNVSQTAESLYLHRNSLIYRLDRISEITGMNLDDADDRFSLQLTLKLQPLLAAACRS